MAAPVAPGLFARLNPFARLPAPNPVPNPIVMRAQLQRILHPEAEPPVVRDIAAARIHTDHQLNLFVKNVSLNVLFAILFLSSGHTPDSAAYFKLVDQARLAGPKADIFNIFLQERERLGGPLSFGQKCRARFFYTALYSCSSVLENTLHEIVGKIFSTLRNPEQKREAQEAFLNKALSVVESALNLYIGAKENWARNAGRGSPDDYLNRALAEGGPLPDLYAQFTGLLADHIFTGFSFFRDTRAYLQEADHWKGAWKLLYYPLRLLTGTLFALADLTTIRLLNYSTRKAIRTFAPTFIQKAMESALNGISPTNLTLTNALHELGLKHLRKFHQEFKDKGIGGDEAGPAIVNQRIIQVAERFRTLLQLEPVTDPHEVLARPRWAIGPVNQQLEGFIQTGLDTGIRYILDNLEEILGTAVESMNGIYAPGPTMTQEELGREHERLKADLKEELHVLASDAGSDLAEEYIFDSPSVTVLNRRLGEAERLFAERTAASLSQLEGATAALRNLMRLSPTTPLDPQFTEELKKAAQAITLFDNWRATQDPRWIKLPTALRTKLERITQEFTVLLNQATEQLTTIAAAKAAWAPLASEQAHYKASLAQVQFALDLLALSTDQKRDRLLATERAHLENGLQLVRAELALNRVEDLSAQARLRLQLTTLLVSSATVNPGNGALLAELEARQAELPALLHNPNLPHDVRAHLLEEQTLLARPRETAEQLIEGRPEFVLFRNIKRSPENFATFFPDLEQALKILDPVFDVDPLRAQWKTLLKREQECAALDRIDLAPLLYDLAQRRRHHHSASAIRSLIAQVSDAAPLSALLDQIEGAPNAILREAIVPQFRAQLTALREAHTRTRNEAKQPFLDSLATPQAAGHNRLAALETAIRPIRAQINASLAHLNRCTEGTRALEGTIAPTFAKHPREGIFKKYIKPAFLSGRASLILGGLGATGAAAAAVTGVAAIGGAAALFGGTSILSGALGALSSTLGITGVGIGAAAGAGTGAAAGAFIPPVISWGRDQIIDNIVDKRIRPLLTKPALFKAVAITAMRHMTGATTAARRA